MLIMATCVVCGNDYSAELGAHAQGGRHYWTCSDACQRTFRVNGGVAWLLKVERTLATEDRSEEKEA